MPEWKILVQKRPEMALRRLPRDLQQRLYKAMHSLEQDPRPPNCMKLVGYAELYRIRVVDWRIVYAIEDDRLIVLIVEVAPRASVYRNL
ncbi:MAG: type II toxin-antitoxin system RelE/ParE family toxin [Caldilineaceae bacterium]|nr:type II toxin-antitoxin system RelE/ParE family toxin [Caldilineaceae bacterium]